MLAFLGLNFFQHQLCCCLLLCVSVLRVVMYVNVSDVDGLVVSCVRVVKLHSVLLTLLVFSYSLFALM